VQTIYDVECSGAQRNTGHPFDPRNKLCLAGLRQAGTSVAFQLEYGPEPYGEAIKEIQRILNTTTLLIGVNLKYDIHWGRRYGLKFHDKMKVWDCQLAHFLLTAQEADYPSMDDIARYYNLPIKPDKIKEYWTNGVDTDQIPWDELVDYNQNHDLVTTEAIYNHQVKAIEEAGLTRLMQLCCADLLVLEEMEYNGMKYDQEKSLEKAKELQKEVDRINEALWDICVDRRINFNSGDQLSVILYGGKLQFIRRVEEGQYQTGSRRGQPRFRVEREIREFPEIVKPLKGTELKKVSKLGNKLYKTDESTLLQLKAKGEAKRIIQLVLELSKIQTLIGTYYEGIPGQFEDFQWEDNLIHHNLNQCVAVTGRLSSSKPNLQNIEKHIKECFVTRYE
jgi:DNA polymerase-1